MTEWDSFAKSLAETETAIRNMDATVMQAGADDEKLAALWEKIEEAQDSLKAQKAIVANQLAASVRPDIGEFPRDTPSGTFRITIAWPEKLDWDEEKVAEIANLAVAAGTVPDFVDQKVKIEKKAWDRADPAERAPYLPALTRKPGTRSVKVERIA